MLDHLSTGLIQYDSTKGHFREMLAERWEISSDNTHRFYLKKNLVFSDGTPITANDFAVNQMVSGELDVFVKDPLPKGERDWQALGIEVLKSSPSTLIYFSGVSPTEQQQKVAFNVLQEIWKTSPFEDLLPATSLLPFEKAYKLDVESIKNELPLKSSPVIRLGVPFTYFQKEFLDHIVSSFKKFGTDIQLVVLSREE